MRIYELSKKINISNKEIIDKLADLEIIVKSHLSKVDEDTIAKLTDFFKNRAKDKNEILVPEYIRHFGLTVLPFENVPDPKFFFDKGDYARIHNRIKDSLKAGRGLMVVTGPIGSGKTTLSQMLITEFTRDARLIWMAEPPGMSSELFLFIARELGLNPETSERTFLLRDIRETLLKIKSEGRRCLLIIDEAHLMSDDTIHGIRLLTNLEEGAAKLINVLLLGQEEVLALINRPEMEAFKQRIANLEILGKMNDDRIREYVSYRINVAGGETSVFSDTGQEALVLAFNTGGTPRLINTLCDRSLNIAAQRKKTSVDAHDVYEASKGMGLSSEVFHYIVSLRTRERKNHVPSEDKNQSFTSPQEVSEKLNTASDKGDRKHKHVQLISSPLNQRESELSARDHKGLKKPLMFLLLSVVALILSVFFFCYRSNSPELTKCLWTLISF